MIRTAATLMITRATSDGPEVLMARRTARATFATGLYVFPGGAVDDVDETDLAADLLGPAAGRPGGDAQMSAAMRETAEEINMFITTPHPDPADRVRMGDMDGEPLLRELDTLGLRFAAETLTYWANWITPRFRSKRFDTHFFIIEVDPDLEFEPDGAEIVDVAWMTPERALAGRRDEVPMMFPTITNLRRLAEFGSPGAAIADAATRPVEPVEPAPILDARGNITSLFLPGDDGYEELLAAQTPFDEADRIGTT
jgi:8-oxo-dGTP pyrophosphatase MutT (NUDIX family)